jgi:hypothetical protein
LGRCGDDNAPAAIPDEIWYDGPDGIASTGEIDIDLIVPVGVFLFPRNGRARDMLVASRIIPLRFAQRQNKSGELFGLPEKSLEITAAPVS